MIQEINELQIKTIKMEKTVVATKTNWAIDPAHSEIDFKVRHLMISNVKGSFKTFGANINTILQDFSTAEIDLWIDTASISTGDEKRDEHLRSVDFFDVQNHKQITFTSFSIGLPDSEGNREMIGHLSIKGITKKVKFNVLFGGIVKDPWENEKAGFSVNGKINRGDWELFWNTALETGGIMIGEEVTISCEIELTNIGKKA